MANTQAPIIQAWKLFANAYKASAKINATDDALRSSAKILGVELGTHALRNEQVISQSAEKQQMLAKLRNRPVPVPADENKPKLSR